MKKLLASCSMKELEELVCQLGEKTYRAKQLFQFAQTGIPIEKMTSLSKALREKLAEQYVTTGVEIVKKLVSQIDGTIKYLFSLADGNIIEGVLMQYHHGNTICISSQVGCRMGCGFCASTLNGLVRNLEAGEMLGQVGAVMQDIGQQQENKRAITNIVIMGSGEPLDNYENTVKFLQLVHHENGLGFSYRNITLSTCGLVEQIKRLADEQIPITLAISLHAPFDAVRGKIMQVSKAYSIAEILNAARYYVERTKRRLIVEYALIDGVNDSADCAKELSSLLRNLQCHVNLISLNQVEECAFQPSGERTVQAFMEVLEQNHISVTRRRKLGADIDGACGQLRQRYSREDGSLEGFH
ncbi:23S rRNA (adenine(2503)-C(2))-methyltransferase RlmN [Clostridia bacterium OttesenSCG-928-F22]|nr:23S rRNA (adenine(2503)-C(2))-methyltransferase RlmN [Clostridia bacterium OttesenSCG-928-F22]